MELHGALVPKPWFIKRKLNLQTALDRRAMEGRSYVMGTVAKSLSSCSESTTRLVAFCRSKAVFRPVFIPDEPIREHATAAAS